MFKQIKYLFLICPLMFAQVSNINYRPNDTVAIINGNVITAEEFKARFELMPFQGKEIKQSISEKKKEILYSIVAEKIFSNEVITNNLSNDSALQVQEQLMSNIFLRDILYKTLIPKNIEVNKEEYINNYKKFSEEIVVILLKYYSLADANLFLKNIKKSKNQNDYYLKNLNKLFVVTDTIIVSEGLFKKEYEDEIFKLEINQYSNPIKGNEQGYIVAKVVSKNLSKKLESISIFERKKWIEDKIKSKKEDTIAHNMFFEVLKGQTANSDSVIFKLFTNLVFEIINSDSSKEKLELNNIDFEKIRTILKKDLNNPFISTKYGEITLNWVIEFITAERLKFKSKSMDDIQSLINSALKVISQNKILAGIAKEKNLFLNEEFKKDVSNWMDNYRYHFLINKLKDSLIISNQDFVDIIQNQNELLNKIPMSIKINEAYFEKETDALYYFDKIINGEHIEKVSLKYHRKEFKNGISDFVHVSKYPLFGAYSLISETNELIGVIKNNNGFSIFKITEKNIPDSIKFNQAIINAKEKVKKEKLNLYISNLAKKQNVKVFEDNLEKVNVSSLQMFTTRKIGFGGKIIALPMVSPQFEWSKNFNKKTNIMQ